MSRVRSKNTKPELVVRSLLQRLGFRFTISSTRNKSLPGRPDIVLPKFRTVVFVHGCFWHRHIGCKGTTMPKSRTDWWTEKFRKTVARDRKNQNLLIQDGWKVIIVWECELNKRDLAELALRLDHAIRLQAKYRTADDPEILKAAEAAAEYGRK